MEKRKEGESERRSQEIGTFVSFLPPFNFSFLSLCFLLDTSGHGLPDGNRTDCDGRLNMGDFTANCWFVPVRNVRDAAKRLKVPR